MREIFPGAVDAVEPSASIAALDLGALAPADRPYTVANFVQSADGRASVGGGSTGLGDDGDKTVFRALRGVADAILAGTGTIAAEHYGALGRDPSVAAQRARLGLPAQPPLVTVTRRGEVPGIPLLDDPASTLIVYAGADVVLGEARATVEVIRRRPEELTMPWILADLRRRGIRLLLCEGGPSIFGDLVASGVCDELFVSVVARIAGGEGGPITRHLTPSEPLRMTLRWAFEQDGSLYLRYGLRP